jgi:ribosomal protein L40E
MAWMFFIKLGRVRLVKARLVNALALIDAEVGEVTLASWLHDLIEFYVPYHKKVQGYEGSVYLSVVELRAMEGSIVCLHCGAMRRPTQGECRRCQRFIDIPTDGLPADKN